MKILVIPDLHGRDIWKIFADLRILSEFPNLKTEYDEYVFLGDYTDSFHITNDKILQNLKEIIQLKKNYPKQVILLTGNHDLQYIHGYNGHGCTGYRPEAFIDLHELFSLNIDLFQPIYRINEYIFTHAGITSVWFNKLKRSASQRDLTIADFIAEQYYLNNRLLFNVGAIRGGYNQTGGIFWADETELKQYALQGYHQIVGHTPVKEVYTHKVNNTTSITFVDTEHDYYELVIK
jgi:hypothetical protein